MKMSALTEDWILSELILNNGYTKQRLASFLQITPSAVERIFNMQRNQSQYQRRN